MKFHPKPGHKHCHGGAQHPMPGAMQPGIGPQAMSPQAVGPQAMGSAPGAFPMGAPSAVAPVRRVVHPTRYQERHRVTRYPVENIYPSHTHNVHHHVTEQYCSYPHTESHQDCYQTVNHCCNPQRRRRPW